MNKLRFEGGAIVAGGVAALSAFVLAHSLNKPHPTNPQAAAAYEGIVLPGNRQLNYFRDGTAALTSIDPRTGALATMAIYDCEGRDKRNLTVLYPQHHDGNVYSGSRYCADGRIVPAAGFNLPGRHS